MEDSKSLLAAAAFYDSHRATAPPMDSVPKSVGQHIVRAFVECSYRVGGAAPERLDAEGLSMVLSDGLPGYFKRRDPRADSVPAVLDAYLDFLHETEVVIHAFEQRQTLTSALQRFAAAVESGALAGSAPDSQSTVRHRAERVGRNEPCPCGSGKKFKKCCGRLGTG